MKTISNYISEKLNLSKDTFKMVYNPDILNDNDMLILSMDDEDGEYFDYVIDQIDDKYDGFIKCYDHSLNTLLTNNKYHAKIENWLDNSDLLYKLIKSIMTGRDAGYEAKLKTGHIEIDCINNGSRVTNYIYAVNKEIYDDIEDWFDGNDDINLINLLSTKDNIQSIEIKK